MDFSLATDDFKSGIDLVSEKILSHGVTSFCPTLVTSPPSVYHQVRGLLPSHAQGDRGLRLVAQGWDSCQDRKAVGMGSWTLPGFLTLSL